MNSNPETDFDFIDWALFCAESTMRDCDHYAHVALKWQEKETTPQRKAVLAFLSDLFTLHLPWGRDAGQALMPDHIYAKLQRNMLSCLVAQLPRIGDNELRARIVDAAWFKERACAHDVVPFGVEAYLAEAARRSGPDRGIECLARLQRAVTLAISLGRRGELVTKVFAEVEATIQRFSEADSGYLIGRLMELLLQFRQGDAAIYSALAHQLAESAAVVGDHDRAVAYLEIAVRWHQREGSAEAVAEVRGRIVEILERTADKTNASLACHLLTQAIEVSRQIPDNGTKTKELRVRLQGLQHASVADFARYEQDIDLADCFQETRLRVGGRPVGQALWALCVLRHPTPIEQIRSRVTESMKDSVLLSILPRVKVSATGRVLARDNGLFYDPSGLESEMFRDVAFHQQVFAMGAVRPAIALLQLEHGLRLEDFLYLVGRSPFVPTGREYSFARGLALGFWGDFSVAAHMLVPQVENSIRLLLEQAGAVTTTLTSNRLQNEKDLNQLLLEPKAIDLFGEPLLFDLRALLTEKSGANLRNELAHGLFSDGAAEEFFAYFWWMTLRLVLTPLAKQLETSADQDTDKPPTPVNRDAQPQKTEE
jgi:hypothetical protein